MKSEDPYWYKVADCLKRSADFQLYIVTNSARKEQFVLAKSSICARWFSFHTGHIRAATAGLVGVVRQDWLAVDDAFRSSLRRALAAGEPGAIVRVGNHATIPENINLYGHRLGLVYAPISSAV